MNVSGHFVELVKFLAPDNPFIKCVLTYTRYLVFDMYIYSVYPAIGYIGRDLQAAWCLP